MYELSDKFVQHVLFLLLLFFSSSSCSFLISPGVEQTKIQRTDDNSNNYTASTAASTAAVTSSERQEKKEESNVFPVGHAIEAKCEGWAKAYPGVVDMVNVRSDGSVSYGLTFQDGEVRESVESTLVSFGGGCCCCCSSSSFFLTSP